MEERRIDYQANKITIDGNSFTVPYIVKDAFEIQGKVVVLMNPDIYFDKPVLKNIESIYGQFRNLQAFSARGEKLWEAEFPENSDYYFQINSRVPLLAVSFSCFICEIDIETGKIKSQVFTK